MNDRDLAEKDFYEACGSLFELGVSRQDFLDMAAFALACAGLDQERVGLTDAYHYDPNETGGTCPNCDYPAHDNRLCPDKSGSESDIPCECLWPEPDEEAEDLGVAPEEIV